MIRKQKITFELIVSDAADTDQHRVETSFHDATKTEPGIDLIAGFAQSLDPRDRAEPVEQRVHHM